jgi:hypothetical protein
MANDGAMVSNDTMTTNTTSTTTTNKM